MARYNINPRFVIVTSGERPTVGYPTNAILYDTTTKKFYQFNGTSWDLTDLGGASNLDALTDVDLTTDTPDNGDVLTYTTTGTKWVPSPPPGAGGGEANTLGSVGTGEGTLPGSKVGTVLNVKSLKQGSNVTLTNNTNDVTIASAYPPDASNTTKGIVELSESDGSESAGNRAVQDNDPRLTNPRTPTAHNHATGDITSGTLGVTRGGTGKSTMTEHALLKGGAGNTLTEITVGTEGHVLKVVSGTPAWAAESGGSGTFARTAFTYLVYHDGSNYVARNGRTGAIEFSNATDGFATLNSAIDATSTLGGGVVVFDGTILGRSMLTPKNNVWVMGRGSSSVLKQDNTQNLAAVVRSNGFAGLSALTGGTGGNGGVESFYLTNCVIDGNKANNTSVSTDGIQFYGFDHHFEDVNIRNCKGRGMYTEWDDDPLAPNIRTSMEAFYYNIRIHDNDGDGWLNRGPHDWVGRNIITYDNGGHGYVQEYSVGNYDGGGFVDALHAYANDGLYGIWLKGGTLHGSQITGESCANSANGVGGIGIYVNGGGLDCHDAWAFNQDQGIVFASGSACQVSGIRAEKNKVRGVDIQMNDVKIEGVYTNNNNAPTSSTSGVGIRIGSAGTAVSVVHIAGYIANHKTTNIEWGNTGNNGVIITPMVCYTTSEFPNVLTGSPNLKSCSVSIENHASGTPKDYRFSVVTYDQIQKALFHRIDGQIAVGGEAAAIAPSGVGLLASHSPGATGTITHSFDNWEGRLVNLPTSTTANNKAGFGHATGHIAMVNRRMNPRFKVRCKVTTTSSSRLYVGFSSATTLPASDTPLASTDSGVLMGWDSADTQFSYWANDGAAGITNAVLGAGTAINSNWNIFELQFDEVTGSCLLYLNDVLQVTLTTNIPATDTALVAYAVVENTTTSARTIQFGQILLEKDFIA